MKKTFLAPSEPRGGATPLFIAVVAAVLTTGFVAYATADSPERRAERAERAVSQLLDSHYRQVVDRGW